MKYRTQELINHCMTRGELWTRIASQLVFSADRQTVDVPEKIEGLREVKPTDDWPWWAKLLRLLRTKNDKGVGDVVKRLTTVTGIKWIKDKSKVRCGCEGRGLKWNVKFPF